MVLREGSAAMTEEQLADYLHTEANESVERIVMVADRRHISKLVHGTAHLLGALAVIYDQLAQEGRVGDFRTYINDQASVVADAAQSGSPRANEVMT